MLDTLACTNLDIFIVGEFHSPEKDLFLNAGRKIICDVDASCIVAGTKNGGTADTAFLCDPVAGFLPGSGLSVITTPFLC